MRAGMVLIALAMAGCVSQVPYPSNAPFSYQLGMRAVHHWELLASDVAEAVRQGVAEGRVPNAPMRIDVPVQATAFDRGFSSLLASELVRRGLDVRSQAALALQPEVQVVAHRAERVLSSEDPAYVEDPLAHTSGGPATRTEALVNVALVGDGRQLLRVSRIYYVDEIDGALYARPAPISRDVSVRGGP